MSMPEKPFATRRGKNPPDLPRIAVADGRFIDTETGAAFYPRGFNYIRLEKSGIWHNTLDAECYDVRRAEAMFAGMAQAGFNIVRVFVPEDTMDDPASPDHILDAAAAHLLDFLERARAHRIRVILSLLHCPASMVPLHSGGQTDPGFFFNPQMLQAKATYHRNIIRRIRAHHPGLLGTVFSFEAGNELCFYATRHPFTQQKGPFRHLGHCYDMERPEEAQRLADDAARHYAAILHCAIKAEDPDALFSINVFTFAAVNRSGPNRLHRDDTPDSRFPARALALAAADIDYLDVHLYPSDPPALARDLASIEWEQTRAVLQKTGKPALIGETGVFREWQPNPSAAARHMRQLLPAMLQAGFQGFLYWTYDCDEQQQPLWHARDQDDASILNALASIHPAMQNIAKNPS